MALQFAGPASLGQGGAGKAGSPRGTESPHSLSCRAHGGPSSGPGSPHKCQGQRRAGQGPSAMAALTLSWADGGHPKGHAWVQSPHFPSWMRSPRLPAVITQRPWSKEVCPTFRHETGSCGRGPGLDQCVFLALEGWPVADQGRVWSPLLTPQGLAGPRRRLEAQGCRMAGAGGALPPEKEREREVQWAGHSSLMAPRAVPRLQICSCCHSTGLRSPLSLWVSQSAP